MVNTDPPYGVGVAPRTTTAFAAGDSRDMPRPDQAAVAGNWALKEPAKRKAKPKAKMRPRDRALVNDFVSDEAFEQLLHRWFANIARVLLPGRAYYIWGETMINVAISNRTLSSIPLPSKKVDHPAVWLQVDACPPDPPPT